MTPDTEIAPEVLTTLNAMEHLLRIPAFRRALDDFAADILERVPEAFKAQRELIAKHVPEANVQLFLSAVIGWILGMPGGRTLHNTASADAMITENMRHLQVAGYISAWSARNSSADIQHLEGRRPS